MLIVKSLLPRINMQSDLTDATLVAFYKAIKLHLPHVANTATSRDGQDARDSPPCSYTGMTSFYRTWSSATAGRHLKPATHGQAGRFH